MAGKAFSTLLAQTSITLPASDPELRAFLATHQAVVPAGASAAAKSEIASCFRWLQSLDPRDDTSLACVSSLSAPAKKKATTYLGILAPDVAAAGWPALAIRRAHAFMAGGESPVKKKKKSPPSKDRPSAKVRSADRRGPRSRESGSGSESPHSRPASPPPVRTDQRRRKRTAGSRSGSDSDQGDARPSRKDDRRRSRSPDRRRSRKARRRTASPDSPSRSPHRRKKGRVSCREDRSRTGRDYTDDSSSGSSGSDSDSSTSSRGSVGRRRRRSPGSRSGDRSAARKGGSSSSRRSTSSRRSGGTRSRRPLHDIDDAAEVRRLVSRDWLRGSDLQSALPARWLTLLCRTASWSPKEIQSHEKAIAVSRRAGDARTENPLKPAWVHRLTFSWSEDEMLTCLGFNLGLLARGETAALYATSTTASMQRRTHHVAFQSELRARHQDCINTMLGGHPPSDLERSSFTTIFLHGYERRLVLLKEEVGLDSRAAVEVVANSARQLEETRTLVSSAWACWAARGAAGNREGRAQFYHERFRALFEPAVDIFLGSGGSSTSGDVFGPSPAGCGPKPDAGAPGRRPSTSLHQTDGGTPARTSSSRPRPSEPSVVPTSPAAGPPPLAAALAWTPPPPAPSPWLGHWPPALYNPNLPIGPPPHGPPPAAAHSLGPPPPYVPVPIKPEPGAAGSGKPPAIRQVQFASPPATAIASPAGRPLGGSPAAPRADGLDAYYPDNAAFVGKSACAYLSGPRSVRHLQGDVPGPLCHGERCKAVGAGPHPTWNCPLRFFSVRQTCPGFLPSGERDPTAWVNGDLTDATRTLWQAFDATLRLAKGARGAPSFD